MSISTVVFEVTKLPIHTVTLYNACAELKREVKTHLVAGIHELLLDNVCSHFDERFLTFEGTEATKILEVKFEEVPRLQEDIDSPKVKELVAELDKLEHEYAELDIQKGLLQRQIDTLDILSTKLIVSSQEGVEENISKFFHMYNNRVPQLQEKMWEADQQIEPLKNKIDKLKDQIDDERQHFGHVRSVRVRVEVMEEGDVSFMLTYQVQHAGWYPVYDVRMVTGATPEEKTVLKLDFFARIRRSCGDDWKDAKILLSTARPDEARSIPELGTLNVEVHNSELGHYRRVPSENAICYTAVQFSPDDCGERGSKTVDDKLCTVFELPKRKTLQSYGDDQKLLIKSLLFECSLFHECVPKMSTCAFLVASAINNTDVPIKGGSSSVYLNGSFVASSDLKDTAPGENFKCCLGVDNAIKVTYKSPHKFNTEAGIIWKQGSVSNTQIVTIQNNKSEDIMITVRENIPKSKDEKIKVKVLQPSIELPKNGDVPKENQSGIPVPGIILNSDHNLEWTEKIEQGEKKELTIIWQIDYPSNETIEYKEKGFFDNDD